MKIFAITECEAPETSLATSGDGMARHDLPASVCYEIPDSAISRSGNPFFIPRDDRRYAAFPSVAVKICKLGKGVVERFAPRYYDEATVGFSIIDLTLLARLRSEGLPWADAVAFDRSCLLGRFVGIEDFISMPQPKISLSCDVWTFDTARTRKAADSAVCRVSRHNTIKTGDILLAGVSLRGILLEKDRRLTVSSDQLTLFDSNVK